MARIVAGHYVKLDDKDPIHIVALRASNSVKLACGLSAGVGRCKPMRSLPKRGSYDPCMECVDSIRKNLRKLIRNRRKT